MTLESGVAGVAYMLPKAQCSKYGILRNYVFSGRACSVDDILTDQSGGGIPFVPGDGITVKWVPQWSAASRLRGARRSSCEPPHQASEARRK